MNLSLTQTTPISTLTWHVLVEPLEQGQIVAWVAEFPECRVQAESQEAALAALEVLLNQRMATIKVMPLQLFSENSENPWFKVCGILKDDASFAEWSDRFWTEKQQGIDDDEVLSVEESLLVM
jgi:predicted RNase H-like HicB family nuclease